MNRWAVTLLLMLAVPFIFVGEIQTLCAFIDVQMDPVGKGFTIVGGCLFAVFIPIARHT